MFGDAADDTNFSNLRRSEINFTAVSVARQFARAMIHHRYGQWPSYRKVQKQAEKLSHIINEFIDKPKPRRSNGSSPQSGGQNTDEGEGEDADEVGPTDTNSLAKRMRENYKRNLYIVLPMA